MTSIHRTVAVLVAAGVLVACTSGGTDDDADNSTLTTSASTPASTTAPPVATTEAPTTTATVAPTSTTEPEPEALAPRDVLAAVGPSIVFVATDLGIGTGIAIADGYIATSAHVVTPFTAVDVTPSGGDVIEDVPVVGIDFAADIAVIGPLDDPLPALTLDAPPAVEGDEVFLVGYPSETDASPTPTISQGIVSRIRVLDDFDQTYVQTDADIAGGQSGGALVDRFGRVVGISGLSLDEAFALALSVGDVSDRLDDLLAGGDDWQTFPTTGAVSGTFTVPGVDIGFLLTTIPSTDDIDVVLSFSSAADVGFEAYLDDGSYAASHNLITAIAAQFEITEEELQQELQAELLEPADDGSFTITVPAGERALIRVVQLVTDEPVEVGYTSSEPLAPMPDTDDGAIVEVGDSIEAIIEPLEWQDIYVVELVAGQTVTVTAASPTGDMAFDLLAPGQIVSAESVYADDSNIGLGGFDAQVEFTAEVDGPHRIVVSDFAGHSGYLLTVE